MFKDTDRLCLTVVLKRRGDVVAQLLFDLTIGTGAGTLRYPMPRLYAPMCCESAWTYFACVADEVPPLGARLVGLNLVPRDVWNVLYNMLKRKDERVGDD